MDSNLQNNIEDAFNSMLRTDYIPLRDTAKLQRLSRYYVDYFGYLRQVVGESDQLIVGRRGTGKTTLLYRALIECVHSWDPQIESRANKRTLAVYLDLSKCQTLSDTSAKNFDEFEHVFVSELVDSIKDELVRNWPDLGTDPNLFQKVFSRNEVKRNSDSAVALGKLSSIVLSGVPRSEEEVGPRKYKSKDMASNASSHKGGFGGSAKGINISSEFGESDSVSYEDEIESSRLIKSRLAITDILRVLGELRDACEMSHIVILVDEFSSVTQDLQRRFCTLLRKILGNHSGVYLKVCAITDNYSLGSSIILQRDIFQLSLDLDAYVERSDNLGSAMDGLRELTNTLVTERLREYTTRPLNDIFEDPAKAWVGLSRSAMGVPRTVGIALKQAFYRCIQSGRSKIRQSDIEYGIKYATKAYLDQFLGAAGIAIPSYCEDIWGALTDRAIEEKSKVDTTASHFMILQRNEEKLRYLNMFFLVHLITKGRTTKKEKLSRSLYSFDYGVCLENNLEYGTDKNTIRQQRFAYDDSLAEFDKYFVKTLEKQFQCTSCSTLYKESDLDVAGQLLAFCPKDRADLREVVTEDMYRADYTEEEIKIIGAIRSSQEEDKLLARQIADDVGCYVQKVAKFGEKLEREFVIERKLHDDVGKKIYFKGGGR
ncbi:hypothetical protein [Pseudomonas sp. HY2-MNA-CIBAN-0224]|uniref:ORC-CDC6 family AAA ATPase n=1 Tax=Pseudomonas sp. HY2-MNA-CIBAN-0224 TaxID=3140471 RepID=UPI00331AE6B8